MKTKRYPNGVPNQMLMRAVEGGTSFRRKTLVVRKSARKFLTSDSDWKKQSLTYTRKEGAVEVALSGFYQDVQTDILIRISPAGEMNVSYVVAGQPNGYLRETGLSFYLPERLDYLQWERKGMWSCYPEGAFAGNTGETSLYNPKQVRYGENLAQPWSARYAQLLLLGGCRCKL